MMEQIATFLGIPVPERFDMIAAGSAAATILVALLLGWAAGKWVGPKAAHAWERRVGLRGGGVGQRLCAIIRDGLIWLLLAIAMQAYDWPPLATFLLGLAAAIAAGLAVFHLLRGLSVVRLAATLLGTLAFVAVFADAIGGLSAMAGTLDGVAVMIGTRRLSLLDLLQIGLSLGILYLLVRLANRILGQILHRTRTLDPTQRLLAQKLASVAILVVAFFLGLAIAGIDVTALAVFGGAFGLAIGFGLQKTVGNLFAGIILLMDRSIKPGDVIVVGESFGQVTKIGVRAVSVVTRDGKEHLIPNEDLMTREVENWSFSSKDVRIHIPVGVSYDADIGLAQRLMIDAAQATNRVLTHPKPTVWMRAYGESSVDFEILVWISDPEAGVGNVQSEILNRLWLLFKENGIEIPYPQRDVHVRGWPGPQPEPAPGGPSGLQQQL